MEKLELFYPAKPYKVAQAFGIYNPAYLQFGYDHHNGIDFLIDTDGVVNAMCDGVVVEVKDYPTGAGKAVRYRTANPVLAEGVSGYVEFMYMHGAKQLVTAGQIVKAGTPLMVADNTGFSTGPHTHISAYFVNPDSPIGNNKLTIAGNAACDWCFDHSKYFNGYYSDDSAKVFSILGSILSLLKGFLKKTQ